MSRKRITISFLSEDRDIIKHLQTIREQRQINISCYIRELIRNDMNGSPSNNSVDALAQAIAEKLNAVQIVSAEKKPTDGIASVGFEEKMIIDQLF